jgi:diaminohydroxyphosphoribosylaminopyrimidine deaminase / 5-amino-6-(5-phosphoribosylamino)uracil reductase
MVFSMAIFFEMDQFSREDKKYMNIALSLARKGRFDVAPNPMVGAVIVKDDKVLAQGYHRKAGTAHAEIDAMANIQQDMDGKKMYVTLEPCNIWAKTPPCTDALIKGGFSEVIIACLDPNPQINGAGAAALEKAGIKVKSGLFKEKAEKLNEVFFKHIKQKTPFLCAKIAASVDGKIAADDSSSKWITSSQARKIVQDMRRQYRCVATGINTVLCDNATLLPRIKDLDMDFYKNYFRVVFDNELRIGLDANIIRTADLSKVILVARKPKDTQKADLLKKKGIDILYIENRDTKKPMLKPTLEILYQQYGVTSVLIESGKTLLSSFLREGLIDKFVFFLAPKIIGKSRYGFFDDFEIENITSAYGLVFESVKKAGPDLIINAYPKDRSCLQG